MFICPICGNSDVNFVGYRNGKPYCRKCLSFRGKEASDDFIIENKADYSLRYRLSKEQQLLSRQLLENFKNGINTLVHAVCGSGKTEIVLETISFVINSNLRVGFAVPRKDVVRELAFRFKEIFTQNKVVSVYGGNTKEIEGDLVCLTTHQLFRYQNYFDLLIMDEIDAFPYKGNDVLNSFFAKSIRGYYILLSATPHNDVISKFCQPGYCILKLNKRFHGHPLPVPHVIVRNGFLKFFSLIAVIQRFEKTNQQVFIFCPTIAICENTHFVVSLFIKKCSFVHSKCLDRNQRIDDFRNKKFMFLFTTAVLERGVTVKGLNVIVFQADSEIYDSHALIQIAGRVGRKADAPEGEVIFIANKSTKEIQRCISEIEAANRDL